MPCCERASMSLIVAASEAVISSNSVSRSLIGRVIRCTYFLLANGCVIRLTRLGSSPSQKSVGVCGGSGSIMGVLVEVDDGGVAVLCCAKPGIANTANRKSDKNDNVAMRIFILKGPFEW